MKKITNSLRLEGSEKRERSKEEKKRKELSDRLQALEEKIAGDGLENDPSKGMNEINSVKGMNPKKLNRNGIKALPEELKGQEYREKTPVRCRVTATTNNTKVVRTWYDKEKGKRTNRIKTAGCRGFKNAKRGTVYAAQERGAYMVKTYGKEREGKDIHLHRRGMGVGRLVRLSELEKSGRKIVTMSDATKDAHNGCRRKKKRRI